MAKARVRLRGRFFLLLLGLIGFASLIIVLIVLIGMILVKKLIKGGNDER